MDCGDAFSFTVHASEAGMRLDVLLASRPGGISRSLAAQLIDAGHVRVNGVARKPGYRVRGGEVVAGRLPDPQPTGFLPEPIPLHRLYEDADIIVIDKPAGLVVHPAPGHRSGTLVNALLYHCPDLTGIGTELRPGIVHRLDKDTSGTLVVAKTAAALEHLAGQFKRRTVRKDYLALVHGEMPAPNGTVRLPIGRHPVDRKRMSTMSRKGREAETEWRVLRTLCGASLLEVGLRTGRTHQIRVHCAAIGHPILGDPVYGRGRGGGERRGPGRQMLHALRLEIDHPRTGERMRFESPLPEDMLGVLRELGGEGV
jgi:23S rRNA pseudouridine1911/1915/1917 synthase